MRINGAFQKLTASTSRFVRIVRGPSSWNGCGALQLHRRVGLVMSFLLIALSVTCLATGNFFGAFQAAFIGCVTVGMTTACWWMDRQVAVRLLGDSKSAQECASLIVTEMREEGISFDEEQLAESVAAVLLQQSVDLAGFVDATVRHHKNGLYHVVGSAQRRSGETIEFMSKLCVWWSGGGQVHCHSLGLVWS